MRPARAQGNAAQLALAFEPVPGDVVPTAAAVAPIGIGNERSESIEVRPIRPEDLLDLTPNELRLLEQAARGLTDKQIAYASERSYRTVQTQMQVIRRKMGIRTRFELGFYASQWLVKDATHD